MRKRFALLMALLIASGAANAAALEFPAQATLSAHAYLRDAPSLDAAPHMLLMAGSTVTLLSQEDGWFSVAYGAFRGYIEATGLELPDGWVLSEGTILLATDAPGDTIRQVQQWLHTLGYDTGSADGVFGSRTRRAVEAFQQAYGWT